MLRSRIGKKRLQSWILLQPCCMKTLPVKTMIAALPEFFEDAVGDRGGSTAMQQSELVSTWHWVVRRRRSEKRVVISKM